jgi:hypothetical protein
MPDFPIYPKTMPELSQIMPEMADFRITLNYSDLLHDKNDGMRGQERK